MRLTLRTLLAYLDDILEPDDTEDIAKKIEESEFATNLVHRTRDCMRRLRLGVPPVVGRGLATDPNTVAEYLDNTLPSERVPEFEKICLESDVHLAEVASGHQILTLVLGEPAEINPEARQRMYRLAAHVDAPPVQADAAGPPPTGATPPALQGARRARPEVPEYLRETRSRMWPVAATIFVAALLTCGTLLMYFGPAQWRESVTALATPATEDAAADDKQATTPAAAQPAESATPEAAMPETGTPATDAGEAAAAVDDPSAPPAPEPGEEPKPQAGGEPDAAEMSAEDDAEVPVGKTDPGKAAKAARAAARPAKPLPGALPDDNPAVNPAVNPDGPAPLPDAPEPDAGPPAASAPAAGLRENPAGESFGRYTSKHEVLLKFDADSGDWKRLGAMAPLAKGDRLLSLPCFRPTIALGTNISIQPDGAALLELVGWTDEGVPIVAIEYGRLLMMTVGKAGNALQLNLDGQQDLVTFVDAESTLALEVRRVLPPGKDPREGLSPLVADVYATSGLIRLSQGDAPVELQAPEHRTLLGAASEPAGGEFPKWVTSEALSDVDRRAAAAVEPQLPPDRPVSLFLKEASSDKRREVRSLAIRASCYLGSFDACTAALNEKDEKNLWPTYIDELRSSVARSPDTAAKVRTALDKQRNADAAGLFRMLWGYSADDLRGGADRDLVDALNHDSLDLRVLAFWNLQNITGLPNFGYYPGDLAKKRNAPVNSWREKLRQGKIVPRAAASSTKSKAPAKPAEKVPS